MYAAPDGAATNERARGRLSSTSLRDRLDQIRDALDDGSEVALHWPNLSCDALFAVDWIESILTRRFPDLISDMAMAEPAGESALQVFRRTAWGDGSRLRVTVGAPTLCDADIIAALCFRGSQMMRHHGLLIPRRTLCRAAELAPREHVHLRLTAAYELLDATALAYRQTLRQLAKTSDAADLIEHAFSRIARAVESFLPDRRGAERGERETCSDHPYVRSRAALIAAFREFDAVVAALGGPRRAAVVLPQFVNFTAGRISPPECLHHGRRFLPVSSRRSACR